MAINNDTTSTTNEMFYHLVKDFPDISMFNIEKDYPAVSVPVQMTSKYRTMLQHITLQKSKTKNVYPDPSSPINRRLILLKSNVNNDNKISIETENDESIPVENSILVDTVLLDLLNNNQQHDVQWYRNTNYNETDGDTKQSCLFTTKQSYDGMSADEVFDILFTSNKNLIPSAFETVGQIAHINLRDEQLPYKYWIGKILLDKNYPTIKTIVNKTGLIETKFRTFPMEVIAGYGTSNNDTNWSITTVKEEGSIFKLDFQTVYWNSRLSAEHKRIVNMIRNTNTFELNEVSNDQSTSKKRKHDGTNDDIIEEAAEQNIQCTNVIDDNIIVVADLMAGVGPFAVPLTSTKHDKQQGRNKKDKKKVNTSIECNNKKIFVYANDLNPESFKYLRMNCTLNQCHNIQCYNVDARQFVKDLQDNLLKQHQRQEENNDKETNTNDTDLTTNSNSHNINLKDTIKSLSIRNIDHVIMNLPASAPEFLDSFRGWRLSKLPRIHVHCFAPKPIYLQLLQQQQQQQQNCTELDNSEGKSSGEENIIAVIKPKNTSTPVNIVAPTLQDTYQVAVDRCSIALGCTIDWQRNDVNVHLVRDVAPTKNMLCVSFTLPNEVRYQS
jgi:tRNA (guanine37-N1)-methyltransferase